MIVDFPDWPSSSAFRDIQCSKATPAGIDYQAAEISRKTAASGAPSSILVDESSVSTMESPLP
jgi:hypothetical protein